MFYSELVAEKPGAVACFFVHFQALVLCSNLKYRIHLGMIPYIFVIKKAQGLNDSLHDALFIRSELLLCHSENNQ